jgi:hypothetical protein
LFELEDDSLGIGLLKGLPALILTKPGKRKRPGCKEVVGRVGFPLRSCLRTSKR